MRGKGIVTFHTNGTALRLGCRVEDIPQLPTEPDARRHLGKAATTAADRYLPGSPSSAAILCCYYLTLHEQTNLIEQDTEVQRVIRKAAELGRVRFIEIVSGLLG